MESAKTIAALLLKHGKIAAAVELHNRIAKTPEITDHLVDLAFRTREARDLAFAVALQDIKTLPFKDLVPLLVLAEGCGQLTVMRLALADIERRLAAITDDGVDSSEVVATIETALFCFFMSQAERLVSLLKQPEPRQLYLRKLSGYRAIHHHLHLDPDELPATRAALQHNRQIRVDKPTVVVRILARLWDTAEEWSGNGRAKAGAGLEHAAYLKSIGHSVCLAPQFSLAGPSLFAPFSREQTYPLAFLDRHKYSHSGPFVHFKKHHNGRIAIDRRGYSGWSEVQTLPHLHDFASVPMEEARTFANRMREENFASSPKIRPGYLDEYGSFGLIPLQLPADSVNRLSRFAVPAMIEAAINFFHARNLTAVIRRHPKCTDKELSSVLKSLRRRSGVFVSQHPTRDMILHTEAVALCNSSMGWDALLAHKPLICFGAAEYSRVAYNVHELADLEEAPPFDEMYDADLQDKFLCYYWSRHVAVGRKYKTLMADRISEALNSGR